LLFSATIGKNIKDMTRVHLKEKHEYICIHDFDSIESMANEYESKEDKEIAD
jgi:hypothetical protein